MGKLSLPSSEIAPRNRWLAAGVFLVLLSVYLATYSGRIHSVDEAHIVAVTASLGKGRLDVNQVAFYEPNFSPSDRLGTTGASGDIFCKKGLATSLLAFPFFWGFGLLAGTGAVHAAHLANAVVTALTGSVLYLYLTELGFSRKTSAASSLLWGTGTLAWPYARMLFAEPVGALGLAVALYAAALFRRRPETWVAFLAGFGTGSIVLAIPSTAPLLPVLVGPLLPLLWNRDHATRRKLLQGGIGGVTVPLLVMFAYNALRFGTPLDTGYRFSLADLRPPLTGIVGLLFTPARGLVFYSPLVLLAVPGYIRGWRRYWTDFAISLALLGSFLLFYGAWVIWHGGWSWGPRYLVPVLPALFGPIAWTLESLRSFPARFLISLIVVASLLVQSVGAVANYVETEFILEKDPEAHPDQWFYRGQGLLWDPLRSPLVVQAQNLGANLDLGWMVNGHPDKTGVVAVTLALCVGGLAWQFVARRRPMVLPLVLCAIGMLPVAWILVARSTNHHLEPFRGDGRLEALDFISAHRMPDDGLVSDTGYLYEFVLEQYPGLPPTYILPASDPDMATSLLNLAVARHPRIWFIGGYVIPGDTGRWMKQWLSQNAFLLQAWDFAYHHVSLFSTPGEVLVSGEPGAVLGDMVRLRAFRLTHRREGMDAIFQLALYWEALGPLERDYQVFVHAYDPAMNLLAQADHPPVNGFYPTSSWRPGEIIEDRAAFRVPLQVLKAGFSLAVGLYDLRSPADRLPVQTPEGPSPDGRVWLISP